METQIMNDNPIPPRKNHTTAGDLSILPPQAVGHLNSLLTSAHLEALEGSEHDQK